MIELAGQGADTVKSSVTYTLSPNVETVVLTVRAPATNGTGNASANTINGNFGNNVLQGICMSGPGFADEAGFLEAQGQGSVARARGPCRAISFKAVQVEDPYRALGLIASATS